MSLLDKMLRTFQTRYCRNTRQWMSVFPKLIYSLNSVSSTFFQNTQAQSVISSAEQKSCATTKSFPVLQRLWLNPEASLSYFFCVTATVNGLPLTKRSLPVKWGATTGEEAGCALWKASCHVSVCASPSPGLYPGNWFIQEGGREHIQVEVSFSHRTLKVPFFKSSLPSGSTLRSADQHLLMLRERRLSQQFFSERRRLAAVGFSFLCSPSAGEHNRLPSFFYASINHLDVQPIR